MPVLMSPISSIGFPSIASGLNPGRTSKYWRGAVASHSTTPALETVACLPLYLLERSGAASAADDR
ncbi:hypothetical protein BC828DRAFT_389017 [Blastocladiella britannica]|nr:hypothetical protein BC828DRAFT_389017 [Blastocladiella britannica]